VEDSNKTDETKQKFVQNNLDKGALKLGMEINVILMVDADLAYKSSRSCYCPGLLRPLSAANLKGISSYSFPM
jgi:hypothetical protein